MISSSSGIRGSLLCLALLCSSSAAELKTIQQADEALAKMVKEGQTLLDAGDYEALDKRAAELETSKAKTISGNWVILQFVEGLEHPPFQAVEPGKQPVKPDKEAWKAQLSKLEKWKDKTGSAFSLAMFGAAEVGYAWSIRGGGYANTVSGEQWQAFEEILKKAVVDLESARLKNPKELETYRNLLIAGMGLDWPKQKLRKLFDEFMLIEPEYSRAYENMATPLLERWGGDAGEWQSFVNSIPKLVPGDSGLEIYARTAMAMQPYCTSPLDFFGNGDTRISWEKMRSGFEVMRKRYPDSATNLNLMLKFYCTMGDREGATAILKALDDNKAADPAFFGGAEGEAAVRKFVAGPQ